MLCGLWLVMMIVGVPVALRMIMRMAVRHVIGYILVDRATDIHSFQKLLNRDLLKRPIIQ